MYTSLLMKSFSGLQYVNVIAYCGLLVVLFNVNWSTLSETPLGRLYKRATKETFDDGIPIYRKGNLADEYRRACPAHQFESVKIVSRAPDIMLIEGFVTEAEATFLVKAAYIPCDVWSSLILAPVVRDSQTRLSLAQIPKLWIRTHETHKPHALTYHRNQRKVTRMSSYLASKNGRPHSKDIFQSNILKIFKLSSASHQNFNH